LRGCPRRGRLKWSHETDLARWSCNPARVDAQRLRGSTGLGEDKNRARDSGFDAHLTKPPQMAQLLRLVEKVGTDPVFRRQAI
jgi:hypothetical protein